MVIRPAAARELIDLRNAVLRNGLPRELAMFAGDDNPTSRHFAAEDVGAIVGCVTLHLNEWNGEPAWQLRGMAVAPTHQNRGIGQQLLAAAEKSVLEAPANLPRLLWCNARVPALAFYQRQGWEVVSGEFDIPHSGPHVKMTRQLVL
jgi:GNAT superfamily N-acetyltransferase